MCRIVSLFLLQGLKGGMSGDARDFSNSETWAVMFIFLQSKAAKEIHAILTLKLGEHAPSYATVKNWVALFKRDDFSTCAAPRAGRPKKVTTPEIIDKIHELILEDRRISAKSIVSNWASHVSGSGPSFLKIWTCRSSPRSGSRNARTGNKNVNSANRLSNFSNFFGAIQMIFCRARLVTMDDTRLYHYDPETKQQSMESWHSFSPSPKNSECKNPLEIFLPRFFGIKTASSSVIIFQRAKLTTRSITHLCWCNWRTFWRKNATLREGHQGDLVLAWQCPGSPGTCNPEETGLPGLPVSWSPTLFSGSGPVGLPPVPWTEKTIERSPFFIRRGGHCCRGDGQPSEIFLGWLAKVRATG